MLLIEQTLIAYMIEYNKMMTFSVIDMDARYLIFKKVTIKSIAFYLHR